jgi:hypothetical protein
MSSVKECSLVPCSGMIRLVMAAAWVAAQGCYQPEGIIIKDAGPDARELADAADGSADEKDELPQDAIEDAFGAECAMWVRTYGTSRQNHALSTLQTSDGGFMVTTSSESFDLAVGWELGVLKLDALGNVQWSRVLPSYESFYGADVREMPTGDFWVAGNAHGSAGTMDAVVMSLSPSGDILWHRAFGGPLFDWALSIEQAPEGGAILAGGTDTTLGGTEDIFLARVDAAGTMMWQIRYGCEYNDDLRVMRSVREGGYVAAGMSLYSELSPPRLWLLRLDEAGGILWQRAYGTGTREELGDLIQTDDGGFIAVGLTEVDRDVVEDALVVKIDAAGGVEWSRSLGGPGNDFAFSVDQTPEGGFIVAGQTSEVITGPPDAWIFSLDAAGGLQWQRAYGGYLEERASELLVTRDGCLLAAGDSSSFGEGDADMWLLALDRTGWPGDGCPEEFVRDPGAVVKDVELEVTDTAALPVAGTLLEADADLTPIDDTATWQSLCSP